MSRVFSGHQPNFLPYMGFFYKMYMSDVFVYDDDVQFTNNEYKGENGIRVGHNCNVIRIGDEKGKLQVPVSYTFGDKINEVKIAYSEKWDSKMLKTVQFNYSHYPYFQEGYQMLEQALSKHFLMLYELNLWLLDYIVERFGIKTEIKTASIDCPTELMKNERNVFQCKTFGGDVYYSGAGGCREYNNEELYAKNGIKVVYTDFEPTPYRQYHKKTFIPNLSVLDYIMNEGFVLPKEWEEKKNGRAKESV